MHESAETSAIPRDRVVDAFVGDPASVSIEDVIIESECVLEKPGVGTLTIGFDVEGKPCGENHAEFEGEDGTHFELTDAEIRRIADLIDQLDKRGAAA